MSNPRVAIDIVANDKSGKGIGSSEKRLGHLGGSASKLNRELGKGGLGRFTRSFTDAEQAGAKLFGGRSITSGLLSRIGSAREAAGTLSSGLGEAAASGGVLEGALGAVGAAAAATVGLLAAAAYGAFKLADGWARGAASVGNLALQIGVGTKALQEFTAAGERVGVDKNTSAGALGGLSQTLNDARYGRNQAATAMLAHLGVGMKLNQDGTVDVAAMLPAIADAIQRQNSSGARTVATTLGIGQAALPVFRQGGTALASDMKDADSSAPILTDDDVSLGRKIQHKDTVGLQYGERGVLAGQRALAQGVDVVGDKAIEGARQVSGALTRDFVPGAARIAEGGKAIERAAGRFTARQVGALARRAIPLKEEARRYGFSEAEAAGIAANIMLESGGNDRSHERGGSGKGRGLIQWTDKARKAEFQRVMGVDVDNSSRDQQWRFLRYELSHKEAANWRKALQNGQDRKSIGEGYSRYVERSANKNRDSVERGAVAEAIPVQVTVELKNAPAGTRATAKAGRGSAPAVSHALQH